MNQARVAVFGCGSWGKNLVRNFHALGALAAVVETAPAGRAQALAIAKGVPCHDAADAVWQDPSIGGVVLATPAETHAPLCLRALAAGKDVFVEKPLALRYQDGREAADQAREAGRILMVGHILEYHPGVLKLRELVATGQLGKIRYIYSNRLNLGMVRRQENILWSFAPHDIAVILRLVGEPPFQVSAAGGAYIQANIADVTVTQLSFDNGIAAHIFVSWLNPFKEQRLVVVGSEKMAVFDDVKRELVLHDQRVDNRLGEPVPHKGEGQAIPYAKDEPLRLECQAFLSAMETRATPLTDAASGLAVLRVLQAAQRSLITHGQPVVLPME
jgi:predicted dehydrogenase